MDSQTYRKVLKESTCATIQATVDDSNLGIELQQLGALFTKVPQATRSCRAFYFGPLLQDTEDWSLASLLYVSLEDFSIFLKALKFANYRVFPGKPTLLVMLFTGSCGICLFVVSTGFQPRILTINVLLVYGNVL